MATYELPPDGNAPGPGKRWLQRAVAAIAGTALLVGAFFFAVFAVVAGVALLAIVAVRWWWLARRAPPPGDSIVEGEYRVIERRGGEDGAGDDSRR